MKAHEYGFSKKVTISTYLIYNPVLFLEMSVVGNDA